MSHDTNRRRALLLSVVIVGLIALAMATVAFAATPKYKGTSSAAPAQAGKRLVLGDITSFSPSSKVAGSSGFSLTMNLDPLVATVPTWTVSWAGPSGSATLSVETSGTSSVTAWVPAALVADAGSAEITVSDESTAWDGIFVITSGAPVITSVSPTSATTGAASFTLQVNGSNFATGLFPAEVRWNGVALSPASGVIVNPTSVLYATVPATYLLTANVASITVVNPNLGAGVVSNAVSFPVTGPTFTAITPATGSNTNAALAFALSGTSLELALSPSVTLRGTGAIAATTVTATGVTYVPPAMPGGQGTITGSFNLASILLGGTTPAPPGVYDVVLTYTNGGTKTLTRAFAFTVTGSALTSITPATGTNGNAALAFSLTGSGLNGLLTPVVTLRGPGTTGTTIITASGVAAAATGTTMTGTFNLSAPVVAPTGLYDVVITYESTKTLKLAQVFTVTNAAPIITSISPATAWAGSVKAQTLTVSGTGFVPATPALLGSVGSQIMIGTRLATNTTVVSSTQLTVPLTAADTAVATTVPITVINPVPGGGTSPAVSLTVSAETVAPVTVISGADANWHNAPVVLTVTATDSQSGVQFTQYTINATSPTTLVAGTITVPAPAGGSGDGVKTVSAWSTDWCNNAGVPVTATVKIDTVGPKTTATVAKSVKKGTKVSFGYRANDVTAKCDITLKIKKASSGSVARTYQLGSKSSNTSLTYKVNPSLAKGTYKYYVYAVDQAGNKQSSLGVKTFKVE